MPRSARPHRPTVRVAALVVGPVLLLAAALSACGDDGSGSGEADGPTTTAASDDLNGTSWVLTGWSSDGTMQDPVTGGEAVLDFGDAGRVSGSGGCNRFFATWEQDGSSLTMSIGGSTQIACEVFTTTQEAAVFAGLEATSTFQLDGDTLLLLDDAGDTVLEYGAGVSDLEGTTWTATGVNNGQGALVSTETIDQAFITFGDDGAISGTGGCNQITGTVALTPPDGFEITDELGTTLRACADPALDEQEQQFLAALRAATTYEVSGSTLTLRDDSGAMQLTFRLADAGDDTGGSTTTVDPDTPVSSDGG